MSGDDKGLSRSPLYLAFTAYLRSAVELELAALTRRGPPVSVAERERLGEAAFAGLRKGSQRAVDSAARTAAQRALGLSWTADSIVEETFHWEVAAAMRAYAEASAELLLLQSDEAQKRAAPEVRTIVEPKDGPPVDLREIVKSEAARFLKTMYRGVWQEGGHYEQGHMTTRNGSIWSCQRDGARGKPGDDSGDWILAVKAGRDGSKGR